ncbi:Alpha/Beta hydrolase protein [Protomyces lactucae-debilis]|uniref:Alpha/Beta hydrolase protein n=1 Tax=Protomyces lactucae-debilis TaxID=2754530 RepID=A0A1Y2FDT9_PROLT|nr:Alpha/Beta hydrolase protein [Protomyces lactucae-debilis]ORY82090.1 Alpha/Beta hydrolase protein [Protomyces lactucae-debilis]
MITDWAVLGPFSIGTREDPWLDAVQDIYAEKIDWNKRYKTTLCTYASWTAVRSSTSMVDKAGLGEEISISISFPQVNWERHVQTNGWAATQFQAYLRGFFVLDHCSDVDLQVMSTPEFLLDGERYEGDIYMLGEPLRLHLNAGRHQLDIRVIAEVRILGFAAQPTSKIVVNIQKDCALQSAGPIRSELTRDASSAPDAHRLSFQPGKSHSQIGSTRNSSSDWSPPESIDLESVRLYHRPRVHEPRQPRHLPYGDDHNLSSAIYRTPLTEAAKPGNFKSPIVLALHGAGVDHHNGFWRDCFKDTYPAAWILQPDCGKWGDDYHALGAISIDLALKALLKEYHKIFAPSPEYHVPEPDLDALIVLGHSNGAQGAMQFVIRNSDRVIGAAWAAGYLSINRYVPYSQWTCNAASLADKPEFDILRNIALFKDVPCFIRHGIDDDNVPISHGRQMASALDIDLEEIEGAGHWYEGILTTGRFESFVNEMIAKRTVARPLPDAFCVMSWGTPITKFGMSIVQVDDNFILNIGARCSATLSVDGKSLSFRTSAVKALAFEPLTRSLLKSKGVETLFIDGQEVVADNLQKHLSSIQGCVKAEGGHWHLITSRPRTVVLRNLTCILESSLSIIVDGPEILVDRIIHSLKLYHNITGVSSTLKSFLPHRHSRIELKVDPSQTYSSFKLSNHDFSPDAILLTISAPSYADLSKCVRLIPWRTGYTAYGNMEVDWAETRNILVSGSLAKLSIRS